MNRILCLALLLCWAMPGAAQQRPRVIDIHLDDTIQPISADYMARGLDIAASEKADAALGRPVIAVRPSFDEFLQQLAKLGLPPYVQQHIATMARLHREDRYNRATHDVEDVTGHPAQSVRQYVEQHRDLFS